MRRVWQQRKHVATLRFRQDGAVVLTFLQSCMLFENILLLNSKWTSLLAATPPLITLKLAIAKRQQLNGDTLARHTNLLCQLLLRKMQLLKQHFSPTAKASNSWHSPFPRSWRSRPGHIKEVH